MAEKFPIVLENGKVREIQTSDTLKSNSINIGSGKFNVSLDGEIFASSITNNGGTSSSSCIASGFYTPTATGIYNIDTITAHKSYWNRIGNIVNIIGRVDVKVVSENSATLWCISLVANFTRADRNDIHGVCNPESSGYSVYIDSKSSLIIGETNIGDGYIGGEGYPENSAYFTTSGTMPLTTKIYKYSLMYEVK